MRKTALSMFCLLTSMHVPAVTVFTSDLPGELQTCFQSGNCIGAGDSPMIMASEFDTTGAAAFQYVQWNGSSYDWKWLMRYDLLSPPGTISGAAWLTARSSYDTVNTNSAGFTLYFDNSIYGNTPITLTMTSADLAAGTGFRSYDAIDWQIDSGTLQVDPWPAANIETAYEFHFNLLHMSYNNGIFSFNPGDTRGLLFSQSTLEWTPSGSQEYTYSSESLYVHAVPLPASALLFMSGLAGIAARVKRKAA